MQNVEQKNVLPTKPKLRTYVKFKENICTEDYVKHCTSRRKRLLIAQFRIGILPLHIETGRFRDIIDERVCWLVTLMRWRMNYIFCVFAPPTLTTGKTYSIANNQNLLNMSNDEKFISFLKLNGKCLYLLREIMEQKNRNIV